MMIAQLVVREEAREHIRPFDPRRDLLALAHLIEVAFGPELALTGSRMVQDMRQIALWGPFLNLGQFFSPFRGFVWIEDEKLVGNVSLARDKEPGVWTLSNVAVLPEYRGRGIAGALVNVAIDYVRQRGGKRLLLQVRSDNSLAKGLYHRRGFVHFDTLEEMDLSVVRWPAGKEEEVAGLRRPRAVDWQAIYRLVFKSTPADVRARRPLRAQRFRRGLKWWLKRQFEFALGGRVQYELVAEEGGELTGYVVMEVDLLRGPYQLSLYVRPDARGRWERPLLRGIFQELGRVPRARVRAYISVSHPEAFEALESLGFRVLRELDQMSLDL